MKAISFLSKMIYKRVTVWTYVASSKPLWSPGPSPPQDGSLGLPVLWPVSSLSRRPVFPTVFPLKTTDTKRSIRNFQLTATYNSYFSGSNVFIDFKSLTNQSNENYLCFPVPGCGAVCLILFVFFVFFNSLIYIVILPTQAPCFS